MTTAASYYWLQWAAAGNGGSGATARKGPGAVSHLGFFPGPRYCLYPYALVAVNVNAAVHDWPESELGAAAFMVTSKL